MTNSFSGGGSLLLLHLGDEMAFGEADGQAFHTRLRHSYKLPSRSFLKRERFQSTKQQTQLDDGMTNKQINES